MSIDDIFEDHLRVLAESRQLLLPNLKRVVELTVDALRGGNKVIAFGNGGSAADAQHFTAECVCRFESERGPLSALALTTDTSTLTAIGNDYGYEHVFARQVAALARKGDVLFALSTSGNSPNVLSAVQEARALGCRTVAFTGRGGGKLGGLADVGIAVPSERTARIQEVHGLCLHAIAQELEQRLFDLDSRSAAR